MADVANRQMMVKYLNELPERQGIILSLYYYEGFNLKKIGNILNLTESRVSQLHSLALEKLKSKLKNNKSNIIRILLVRLLKHR